MSTCCSPVRPTRSSRSFGVDDYEARELRDRVGCSRHAAKSKAVSQACYNLGTKGRFPSSLVVVGALSRASHAPSLTASRHGRTTS
jgi:hypothetical protein